MLEKKSGMMNVRGHVYCLTFFIEKWIIPDNLPDIRYINQMSKRKENAK